MSELMSQSSEAVRAPAGARSDESAGEVGGEHATLDAEIDAAVHSEAYLDAGHPDHAKAVAVARRLFELRYGEEPAEEVDTFDDRSVDPDDPRPNAVALPELPEGVHWNRERLDRFGDEVILPAGLTQEQSQGLLDWWAATAFQLLEGGRDVDQMRTAFDTVADRLGLDEDQREHIIAWGEANLFPRHETTPARARIVARIERIMNDPEHPYWKASNPAHERAVSEMRGLFEAAYGSE